MEKLTYSAPEMTVTELASEDIVLISIVTGNPGPLPTTPWNGVTNEKAEW